MSRKFFTQVSVLAVFLLALLVTPFSVQAGGVCGGTWTVEKGQTLDSIAATCGTTVSAITAANPGISGSLSVGQVITVPGVTNTTPSTAVPTAGTTIIYNTYNYYNTAPTSSTTYTGTYIVQSGDTFSGIASRFGISMGNLWNANPYIRDINLLYVGQSIYVPGSSTSPNPVPAATATQEPVHLTHGTAPLGTPKGEIRLSNKANGDVYISLQGTMSDGSIVINEYPVSGSMTVKVPSGGYTYVAWVGGLKFTGQFRLGAGSEHTLTFYSNRVEVQ